MGNYDFQERNMTKRTLIPLVLAVLLAACGSFVVLGAEDSDAVDANVNNIVYEITGTSTAVVKEYVGDSVSISIPDKVSIGGIDYSVKGIKEGAFTNNTHITNVSMPSANTFTEIDKNAFKGCTALATIIIPSKVTKIDDSTFEDCTSLSSITWTGEVKSIGKNAFKGCTALTVVSIPKSVESLEVSAFYGCSQLGAINVDINNNKFESIDGAVYNKAKTDLILVPGGKQGSFTVPLGVTKICASAFDGCSKLTGITLSKNVAVIESHAFRGCTKVYQFEFSNNLYSIAEDIGLDFYDKTGAVKFTSVDALKGNYFRSADLTNIKLVYAMTHITLNTVGGEPMDPLAGKPGTAIPPIDDPVNLGKAFDGWYTSPQYTVRFESEIFPSNDIVIYAKWVDGCTITFVAGDDHEVTPTQVTVKENSTIEEPVPVGTGYIVSGWYMNPNFTSVSKWNFSYARVTNDMPLYAKWAEAYTVTFAMQGFGPDEQVLVEQNTPVAKPEDPTYDDYKFMGWYKDPALTTLYDFSEKVEKDTVIYAKWLRAYIVTFDAGEHGVSPEAQLVEEGGKVIKPADPFAEGYNFDGWFTASDIAYNFDSKVTGNLALFGKWSVIRVGSVTLDKNSILMTTGSTQELVCTVNPSNALDKAVEWTSSDSSVATVDNGKVTAVSDGTATITVKTHDGSFTASCEVTVYTDRLYSITVTSDGHGAGVASQTEARYGTKITLTATPWENYLFDKWESDDVVIVDNSFDMPAKDVAVKALFKPVPTFTVTLDAGEHGKIEGPTTVQTNDSASYKITGDKGYIISDVKVDGESIGAVPFYDIASVTKDHTISATFVAKADAETTTDSSGNVTESYIEKTGSVDIRVTETWYKDGTKKVSAEYKDDAAGIHVSAESSRNAQGAITDDSISAEVFVRNSVISEADFTKVMDSIHGTADKVGTEKVPQLVINVPGVTSDGIDLTIGASKYDGKVPVLVVGDIWKMSLDAKSFGTVVGFGSEVRIKMVPVDESQLTREQKWVSDGYTVYDIAITGGGNLATISGVVKLTMPLKVALGQSTAKAAVYYLGADASLERIVGVCTEDSIEVTLKHLSYYFSAADYVSPGPVPEEVNNDYLIYIVIGVIVAAIVIALLFIMLRRRGSVGNGKEDDFSNYP